MSRTVYAVSTGAYSDYSVQVLFEDRALAEEHAKAIDGEVEEFRLLDQRPAQFTVYNISNDTYLGPEPHEWSYLAWDYNGELYKRAAVSEDKSRGRIRLRVSGTDQGRVRKAFYDRLAGLRAQEEGL